MVAMSLRFHEIAESGHRILNPFTAEKLTLLGEVARLAPGMRQLDLACGKAEMLCQWSLRHGIEGVGVDISEVFLHAAGERARELGVEDRVRFERGDAGAHRADPGAFDVVSCIGATWIGGGLEGTVKLMLPALKEDGVLLVGEPYWLSEPPAGAYEAFGAGRRISPRWPGPSTGSRRRGSRCWRWSSPTPTAGTATWRATGGR